jgi:hypothetical protein
MLQDMMVMGEKETFGVGGSGKRLIWGELLGSIHLVRLASVLLKCSGATKTNTEVLASPE